MSGERFYEAPVAANAKRSAPAALRNREPIARVLREWLPPSGLVLEIASGSGEHCVYFAQAFPQLEWQPSDANDDALASIRAWIRDSALKNVRTPLELDAAEPEWPISRADAILCINMVHISPWPSSLGLLDAAAKLLPDSGPLILYGPWLVNGVETAPSNLEFDRSLKQRDPRWGLRKVEDFAAAAPEQCLQLVDSRGMPANNRMLLLRRDPSPR